MSLPTLTSDSVCSYHYHSLNLCLGLSHDCLTLFNPSDISLIRGKITGLCGVNGSGKTSLAKIIASKEVPGFPNDLKIEYISSHENHVFTEEKVANLTPKEYVTMVVDEALSSRRKHIEKVESLLESADSEELEETANYLADLYEKLDDIENSAESQIDQTFHDLSFGSHLHKTWSELSCGWRYKCRLAAAFTSRPDILIIDEPSFLDAASTEWFIQRTLEASNEGKAMVLLISHKEALLEALCDRVLFINSANQTISTYNCGYQTFRATHLEQVSHGERACDEYEHKVKEAGKSLKNIQTQLHRREKNLRKQTAQNSDQRFIKGKNKEAKQKAAKSSASKVKQLKKEAMEMESLKHQIRREHVKPLKIDGVPGSGTIAKFEEVSYSYEEENIIFDRMDATLEANDRVLLSGENGSGKSTLIKLLLDEVSASEGTVVKKFKALYFPQTALTDLTSIYGIYTALDYLGDNLTETEGRQHLGNFGLAGNLALRQIFTLSAGQRVRLMLAKQLLKIPKPSVIIMDEVSENLDIETRQSLAEVLNHFVGAVIVVSHDKDFRESFKPTKLWQIANHRIYTEYP